MGLLAGDEHASRFREDLGDGSEDEDEGKDEDSEGSQSEVAQARRGDMEMKAPLTREDKKAMALLIVLCAFRLPDIHLLMLKTVYILLLVRNGPNGRDFPLRRHLHIARYNPRCSREFYSVHTRENARTRRHYL
jgi:hypothetical protein